VIKKLSISTSQWCAVVFRFC